MPEFVTCPVCGCKMQVAESLLGRRVRCFGCEERFVAAPETAPLPLPKDRPDRPLPHPPRREPADDGGRDGPYCPACGRVVPWQVGYCPHCGEEFDNTPYERGPARRRFRRDSVPHRGSLLTTLANVGLAAGALSLCLFGAGTLVAVPLGITVLVMAQTDLAQMHEGLMDSQGRNQTQTARASAVTGLVLSLVFAGGYLALFLMTF